MKKSLYLASILMLSGLGTAWISIPTAFAAATTTPAAGGSAVSADTNTANGVTNWTALSGPTITETTGKFITAGNKTIIFSAPSGFSFNSGAAVNATITKDSAPAGTCFTFASNTATPTSSTITYTVITTDSNTSTLCHVTFSNIQVRPTNGTLPASGNITNTGTNTSVPRSTTNYGTLTEVAGALDHITITPGGAQSVTGGSTLAFSGRGFDLNNNSVSGLTFNWAAVPGTDSGTVSSGGILTGAKAGTLTVTATSGAITGTSGIVTVTNVAPSANNQSVLTDEDTPLLINLSGTDANGDTVTYSIVSNPTHGSLSAVDPTTGAVTYNPSTNYNSSDFFTFKTNDGTADSSIGTISLTINPVNDPPVFSSIGNKSTDENQTLSFILSATDVDSNALIYSAANLPSGAAFDANTKTFSWTPTYDQTGVYNNIHFSVTDGTLSASEDMTITVNNVDRAPVLAAIANKTVNENDALSFTISGSDPDNDALTYSAANLPSGAVIDTTTGAFSWTPEFNQSGNYSIIFTVSDGTLSNSANVAIDVGNVNRTPNLSAIGDKNVAEDGVLSFAISATDADNDPLTYSASNLPSGAAFDTGTKTFSWTPDFSQSGIYADIRFEVTDGSLTDFENITIAISNTNQTPILSAIGGKNIDEGQNLNFTLSATDPDGNNLSYSADNLPAGAALDATTGVFSWTPDYSQSGDYSPTLRVCDNDPSSLCAAETITVTVNNVNRAPALDSIGNKTVAENSLLQFTVSATDPDNDSITYSASNLPSGSVFATSTKTFSWTPTYSQAGAFNNVHFTTTDGTLSASEDMTITVNNVNRAPILDSIGNKTTDENQLLSFTISGSDTDGDALTYSASNLSNGAIFDTGTGIFSWKPTFSQGGNYPSVHFQVSDGQLTAGEDIEIKVSNVNQDGGGVAIGGGASLASYNFGPSPAAPAPASPTPISENTPAVFQPATPQEPTRPISINTVNRNPIAANQAPASQAKPAQEQNTANISNETIPANTSLLANLISLMNARGISLMAESAAQTISRSFEYLKNLFATLFLSR